MKRIRTLGVAVVAMAMLAAGRAQPQPKQEVTLKVGDPAPPVLIEKWVKGEPVEKLENGKVYVMEFWATWCGPCIAAFPHVTELQKKYADKGVTVIGVDVWERDRSGVEEFVKKQGDRMGYTVAMEQVEGDKPEGKMAQTWMKAAGRNGIPCSFIIDREGKIAWIGHPMQMDRPLEQVVAGKFDPKKEAALEAERAARLQQFAAAEGAKEWDKALALLDQMDAADPGSVKKYNDFMRLRVLVKKGDAAAANALAKGISEQPGKKDDRQTLLPVLQIMLASPDANKLDTELMLSLAKRLADKAEADGGLSAMWLARVHAVREEYDKAVEAQRAAVEKAGPRQKAAMEQALREYEKKAGEPKKPA